MKQNKCLKCGVITSLIKNGKDKNGVQRYKCKECGKTFIIKRSINKFSKLSDYQIKKIISFMIDDVTLEVIARNLKLNIKTVLFYKYLVFHSLMDYQSEIRLSGTILIDETFISIRKNNICRLEPTAKG